MNLKNMNDAVEKIEDLIALILKSFSDEDIVEALEEMVSRADNALDGHREEMGLEGEEDEDEPETE